MTPPPNSELFCYIIIYFPTPSRESRVSSKTKMFQISLSLVDMITGIILSIFCEQQVYFLHFSNRWFHDQLHFLGGLALQNTSIFLYLNPNRYYRNLFVQPILNKSTNLTNPHCDGPFGIDFQIFEKRSQNTPKDFRNIIYYNIWAKKSPYPYKKQTQSH